MLAQLETDLKAIEYRHDEQYDMQSKEMINAHENIMNIAYVIDEMRRRLERFIILLEIHFFCFMKFF